MKKIQFLAIALVATTGIIGAFAFTTKSSKKTPSVYYYVSGTPYQRILFNTNPINPLTEKSIDKDPSSPKYFSQPTSWTTTPVSFISTTDFTKYIGSISFNEDVTPNGGSDGKITLQEALDALLNYYNTNSALTTSITVDVNTVVTFTPATVAH